MASGKPIIAALDGEGEHLISQSGCGLSCSAENPEALAEAVQRMYRMPTSELKDMGARGKDYCRNDIERTMLLGKLENWMKEVVSGQDYV